MENGGLMERAHPMKKPDGPGKVETSTCRGRPVIALSWDGDSRRARPARSLNHALGAGAALRGLLDGAAADIELD